MNHQDQKYHKPGINPLVAATAGAIVGAGAVLAGAIVASQKGNQDKVKQELEKAKSSAKTKAKAGLDYLNEQVDEAKKGVKKL
jgi:gas vesicle protein